MSKRNKPRHNTGGRRHGGPPIPAAQAPRWEELQQCADLCRGRFEVLSQVQPLLDDVTASELMPNMEEIRNRVSIIERDIATYRSQLERIAAQHANRSGICASPDQLMLMVKIAEQYESWGQSFDGVVLPNVDFIINAYQNCPTGA